VDRLACKRGEGFAEWRPVRILPDLALPGQLASCNSRLKLTMEIVFSVTQEADGGFVAECLSHDIFTQGDNWEQLRKNVQEAVSA